MTIIIIVISIVTIVIIIYKTRRIQAWSYTKHVICKTGCKKRLFRYKRQAGYRTGHIHDWPYTRDVKYKTDHMLERSYTGLVIYKTGHIQDTW